MALLLDANIVIGGEKRTFDLDAWLNALNDTELAISAITVAELWHGVERAATSKQRAKRRLYLERFFSRIPAIAYTAEIALEHARIWASLEKKGEFIGCYDFIVAATALYRGDTVVTFNERHFRRVPKLSLMVPPINRP